MTAADPLSAAVEAAAERAVTRAIDELRRDLPALLADALQAAHHEPLLAGHVHAGCSAAAWGMRLNRNPALAAALAVVAVRDGRTYRYRRSDFDRALSSVQAKPAPKPDPSKARQAKQVRRGGLAVIEGAK